MLSREVSAVKKVLVSACLLGQRVRYNGTCRLDDNPVLERWVGEGRLIAICPEIAAGFSTPRRPAEISARRDGRDVIVHEARVFENDGNDVTDLYLEAGRIALELAQQHDCQYAVLTDGSPSCGSTFIYDGTFSGSTKAGRGSTAALLAAHGIQVFAEADIQTLDAMLSAAEAV